MTEVLDITLVALPIMSLYSLPPGPAALKGVIESKGFKCFCADFNVEIYRKSFFDDNNLYTNLESYFQLDVRYHSSDNSLDERLASKVDSLSEIDRRKYISILDSFIDKLMEKNPKFIGLSVFSVNSVIPCIDFISRIKNKNYDVKIIVGGQGVTLFNFESYLMENDLSDYIVLGDGEEKIVEILAGEEDKNLVKAEEVGFSYQLNFPNYDDYNLKNYLNGSPEISITASKGCIRDCKFCDVNSIWKKYVYKDGESVANEIHHYYKKYGVCKFNFTDSLINGSTINFVKTCHELINLLESNLLPKETEFSGQFICRPLSSFPEYVYELMSRAHIRQVFVGIESGSDKVIKEMGKSHTIKDHDIMMEMFDKYNIECQLLFIVGYPTETEEDFNKTKEMLLRYKKYSDNFTIKSINLNKTMAVIPGSPIGDNPDEYGISFDERGIWSSKYNKNLSLHERIRRRIELQEYSEELGYRMRWVIPQLRILKEMANKNSIYV